MPSSVLLKLVNFLEDLLIEKSFFLGRWIEHGDWYQMLRLDFQESLCQNGVVYQSTICFMLMELSVISMVIYFITLIVILTT